MPITPSEPFKWRHYPGEVILHCVRWYLRYPISYIHMSEMMREQGLEIHPSWIWWWVQAYELAQLDSSIEDFCRRIHAGLANATFEQKRTMVELIIDRVPVANGEVEIRYVVPTHPNNEKVRFCHLRKD